jgi:transcriptional regulator with XRE-family HTH domain
VSVETPESLIHDVGRRIAELRAAADKTQEQLATALGVTVRYIQGVEAGKNLTLHSLARVGAALGVRAVDLLREPETTERRVPGRPRSRRRRG